MPSRSLPFTTPNSRTLLINTLIASATFIVTLVLFQTRSRSLPSIHSRPLSQIHHPTLHPLSIHVRNLWLPTETLSITLHDDKAYDSKFFFIADNPEGGIDPILSFLVNNEDHIRRLFHHLLSPLHCMERRKSIYNWGGRWVCPPLGSSPNTIALDIGANRGFYTMLAASYGYHVYAFDPQPHCESMLQTTVLLNAYQDFVTYTRAFVTTDRYFSKQVRARTGCTGTFPNDNHDGWADSFRKPLTKIPGADRKVITRSTSIDTMFAHRNVQIALMKVDVEGNENLALRSAKYMFRKKKIWNVLVEFNMPMMKRQADGVEVVKKQTLEWIRWMYKLGYGGKIHTKGKWEDQKVMIIQEWEEMFAAKKDGFWVVDAWFFRL